MGDYFNKYRALDFIAQKFPQLEGKKCEDGTLIEALYDFFGSELIYTIENNPYYFVGFERFKAYNFKVAEKIASYIGFKKDSPKRVECIFDKAIKKIFNENHKGDTALSINKYRDGIVPEMVSKDINDIIDEAINLSSKYYIDGELSFDFLSKMFAEECFGEYKFIYIDNLKYLVNKASHYYEMGIVDFIDRSLNNEPLVKITKRKINNRIKKFEKMESIKFTEEQIDAIHNSINNRFSVITGGPGCGKTKVIQAILYVIQDATDYKKIVTSYTGKALKRADEVLKDCNCSIEYDKATLLSYYYTYKFKGSYIFNKVVVIDEASMVSQLVFGQFLSILDNCQVILIGDCDQLPSIDAGQVLQDIINSNKVCVSKLTKNLRLQTSDDDFRDKMLLNYSSILNNDYYSLQYIPDHFSWEFVCEDEKKDVVDKIVDDYMSYINGTNGKEKLSIEDICILTPTKKEGKSLSSTNLNLLIQKKINPYGEDTFCKYGKDSCIRVDDRVILTKNMKDEGVYNGDVGTVTDCNDNYITVEFDDGNIILLDYDKSKDCLELAYAMTVHKSQGSEYKVVLFALDHSTWCDSKFMNKNIIYTAITRTKGTVLFYGSQNVLKYGIEHNSKPRFTLLPQYLASDLV